MGNYEQLKAAIAAVIKANGGQEITGDVLQSALLSMVSNIGSNATFAGFAKPDTIPGTPDQNIFYIAYESGTYSNFSGIILQKEIVFFVNKNGIWEKEETGIASVEKMEELEILINTIFNAIKNEIVSDVTINDNGAGYTAAGSTAGNGWVKSDFLPISYGDKIEYKLDGWQNYCILALFDSEKQRILENEIVGATGVYSGYGNFKEGIYVNTNKNVKFAIVQTRQETLQSANAKIINYVDNFVSKVEFEEYKEDNNSKTEELKNEIITIDNKLYTFKESDVDINNISSGGISYSSGSIAGSNHYVSKKIMVSEGDIINYTLSEARNFCMIGAWKSGVYSQIDSVRGIGEVKTLDENFVTGEYFVPQGVTELQFGTKVLLGSSVKITKKDIAFVYKDDFDKLKKFVPFNTETEENVIDYICGKFYAERAITHARYLTNQSKTVFVDTVSGNDLNNGLSEENPIKTLTKANEILLDGDTLLIKRGSVFIAEETIEKNGIIIDCFGDPTKEKPISYNLIDVTNSSDIEKVVGYDNIYRIAWENNGANGSDRAAIQVFIDGKACGDWTIYTGYTPSSYDVITENGAMQYLQSNVDNSAWCDAYLNNGFSNGWEAGTNYIYFAVSFDPTDQIVLNTHKIQITRSVGQLVKFSGKDNDLRNFIWQTICFNVVDPCKFNENVELYNFVRHGFHYECSWFMNCKTDVLEGIGKHYHYQPKNDQTFYEEIVIFGCKAISRRKDRRGELFDGHGTNTSNPVVTYNRAYVINCYAENLLYASDSPNVANIIIKNITLNNCASIAVYRNNTIIDGVFGTLNPISNTPIITPPTKNQKGKLKNTHLKVISEKGGVYLMYDTGYNKQYGYLTFDNVSILIYKENEDAGTDELATTFSFWNGNSNFYFSNCTFACKHKSGAVEKFARDTDNITNFSNINFKNVVIAGIENNKGIINDNIQWLNNVDDLFTIENQLRLMYISDGEIKTLSM